MPKQALLKVAGASLATGWLFLTATPTIAANAAARQEPCPTCAQAIGLDAFREFVRGEIVPVIVELQEPPGLMHRMTAEQAGRGVTVKDLMAHGGELVGRQKAFIASLPGRGVRALLRETDTRQSDGSLRHVQYQLTYLLNGFVAFVAKDDLPRLRALPEVRRVLDIPPVRLLLDKAIDYSLGTQTNLADRRTAVYGSTLEFKPAGTDVASGHPETPETNRIDGVEGQGMIIAIIDSGVDWRHPMFGGTGLTTPTPYVSGSATSSNDNRKIIYYYALSSPGDPTDDFGHGTLVTSCAAGYLVDGATPANLGYGTGTGNMGIGPTPNGVSLHGMAPQARVMAYKVCGPANACAGDIELAIEDAASPYTLAGSTVSGTVTNTMVRKPIADVINLSLGNSGGDPADSTSVMCNNAALAGTIVVTAAGNDGPGPGTLGSPAAATLAIAAAASYDPGSLSVGGLLAANQIASDTRLPGSVGPNPETGPISAANTPEPGTRQTMRLFPAAGGGPLPGGSLSAFYVLVDRTDSANTVPPEVQNRIALVKMASQTTFFQNANAVAPFMPAAILLIAATESATAVAVAGNIPTFTIGPDDANYLLDQMTTDLPGSSVPQGTISRLPMRLAESAALDSFQPGMAGFSSRGPSDHSNAKFRIVKPDVSAPGVGILGAATPDGLPSATIGLADPTGYVQASGTSFASPITAGTMALVRQRVRDLGLDAVNLSAANYRSTRFDAVTIARAFLMNSASNLRGGLGAAQGDGTNSVASINDFGAGHINVDGALHANAIMVAPTLLLTNEFDLPSNDPPTVDTNGNLSVSIPSASFGAVPIVGVNGSIVLTQQVVLRDVTAGDGSGTYSLSYQNNRNADQPGFQIELVSMQGSPTNSITVPLAGEASFAVRVTAYGSLINADPTEFQWFVTATHAASGQKLRVPFYYRAVKPAITNITSPVLAQIQADQPAQAPSTCVRDTNSSFTVLWTYTDPPAGPDNDPPAKDPVGFRLQEATRTADVFFDDASVPLASPSNTTWSSSSPPAPSGSDWSSQVDPNSGRLAYYVPDTAQQNSSLFMLHNLNLPPGAATLSFLTSQNLENCCDIVYVEISNNGGISYNPVGSYMGDYVGRRTVDISSYAGQAIKVRFRMVSDLGNAPSGADPTDGAPTGWYIEDIRIASDDFHTIATPAPITSAPLSFSGSLAVQGRTNGTYYYRVAGLFTTPLGVAPGPYSETQCVTEAIGVLIITSISVLPNGHALLNCLGPAGASVRIQGAADLHTWSDLGTTNAAGDGTFQFEDTTAPGSGRRFYRLVTP